MTYRTLLHYFLTAALIAVVGCSDDSENTTASNTEDAGQNTDTSVAADTSNTDTESSTGDTSATDTNVEPDVAGDVSESQGDPAILANFEAPGPFTVGHTTFSIGDLARQRDLTVEIWYPADASAQEAAEEGAPVETFVADEAQAAAYSELLAAAEEGCASRRTHAARDAAPLLRDGLWPVVVFSHCFQCVRFSSFSIAEHLASHGIVVAAVDHQGDTLFDQLAGEPGLLSDDFLQVRAGDVRAVLDTLLGSDAPEVVAGALDPERVGMMGHSFGAVTTGRVLMLDARFRAGLALAAPVQNPLFPSVQLTDIEQPMLLMVAVEDNSITEFGNGLIRSNFTQANPPVWKVEVKDAGHWSFSDIAGLTDAFKPGCGEGTRQTMPEETFTYLPASEGLRIARGYAAAFFALHLGIEPEAFKALEATLDPERVEVDHRSAP